MHHSGFIRLAASSSHRSATKLFLGGLSWETTEGERHVRSGWLDVGLANSTVSFQTRSQQPSIVRVLCLAEKLRTYFQRFGEVEDVSAPLLAPMLLPRYGIPRKGQSPAKHPDLFTTNLCNTGGGHEGPIHETVETFWVHHVQNRGGSTLGLLRDTQH